MKTSSVKKVSLLRSLLLALPIIFIAGIVFFFSRMYQRDMQVLTDFITSYQAYDQVMAVASATGFDATGESPFPSEAEERQMDEVLTDLKTKSSLQVSSLIKNEDEAMRMMQEIADLSDKEVSTLKAYREAEGQGAIREALQQAFHDLTKDRQAAFAYFQELGR